MQQYLELLNEIKLKGTWKNAARENMPRTLSLFGYQFRHSLSDGFPILTTKSVSFKNIATELIWFLRGDTNIKFLIDSGVNIWNEDSYQYYQKLCKQYEINCISFEQFVEEVKNPTGGFDHLKSYDYKFGDCGWQYGKLWRNWECESNAGSTDSRYLNIDQISELIQGLKKNPESRRHILTSLNPAHYNDLALFPCHVMAQFNCRQFNFTGSEYKDLIELYGSLENIPKYYLDCHMYQRSADVFLGVPYNTASYALLTHILCEICGFIPGDLIHSFGDVHIYENHLEQVDEQLSRQPSKLPTLKCWERNKEGYLPDNYDKFLSSRYTLDDFINSMTPYDFKLEGYNPQPSIKAKLSTGLK